MAVNTKDDCGDADVQSLYKAASRSTVLCDLCDLQLGASTG
jgi:hypothetical protein